VTPPTDPPPAPAEAPGRPGPDWRIWLGLGITTAWLLLGVVYIGERIGWSRIGDQPADVLGNFLEGAFAPLAFLWLVIGYFLQQKELAQNTQALRLQFTEIQRTAEQAVRQSETIARNELHARQATFMDIAEQVRRQLGAIVGLLYVSSQGATGSGTVDGDEFSRLWSELNKGDPDVFARRMLETHNELDDTEARLALFYGTEIRARHTNNFIFTFERLQKRAADSDSDGILCDAVTGSAHGFVYRLAEYYRTLADPRLADVELTGRDIHLATPTAMPSTAGPAMPGPAASGEANA
jgi:signal transduction histidine kinase